MTDNLKLSNSSAIYQYNRQTRWYKSAKRQVLCLTLVLLFGSMTTTALATSGTTGATSGDSAAVTQPVTPANVAQPAATASTADSTQSDTEKVSINTASAEALAKVMSGVGLKKAQSIINYREQYGPFNKLEDLKQVPGIGDALLERNRDHLTL